jgi:predicted RNA-binding protein YlqC (UPF0109 family)
VRTLVETIVRGLVDHPDEVSIEEERFGRRLVYSVRMNEEDRGHVIGRGGATATAIRTLVNSVAARQRVDVQIEIVD